MNITTSMLDRPDDIEPWMWEHIQAEMGDEVLSSVVITTAPLARGGFRQVRFELVNEGAVERLRQLLDRDPGLPFSTDHDDAEDQ